MAEIKQQNIVIGEHSYRLKTEAKDEKAVT